LIDYGRRKEPIDDATSGGCKLQCTAIVTISGFVLVLKLC